MDEELRRAFKDIHASHQETRKSLGDEINRGIGAVSGKLDMINKQFNEHLVDDTRELTAIKGRLEQQEKQREADERRRKEESERRLQRSRYETSSKDQWKIAKLAAVVALSAALIGAWYLNYLENKNRNQEAAAQRKVLEDLKAEIKK